MTHRGPDDHGVHHDGGSILAHRRLSIIDVEGGQQPLFSADRRWALVCNGEIYNHHQLRQRLQAGCTFATRSDSEVIVQGVAQWGHEVVAQLDGMFAFVVAGRDTMVAARDPLGIKPLYWGRDANDVLWFASEIKSLAGRGVNLEEFPAGHLYSPETGLVRYFTPQWSQAELPTGSPSESRIRNALQVAVHKRLMSDVPLGVFLSGGLDSSVIAALVRKEVDELHSFTVGIEGSPDVAAARLVARHLDTRHHEFVYTRQDVVDVLERVVFHLESYDPALIRSALPTYFVARLASEWVKVVLSGEGADEAFAGYLYFRETREPVRLWRECQRLLLGLHNMNLQRVDRMTMAHGLEARVPFLDTSFLEEAMAMAPEHKLHDQRHPEKWLLRRACEDLLPSSVVWRVKQEFAQGAGSESILVGHAAHVVSDHDMQRASQMFPVDTPTSKEEFLYRQIFNQLFPGPMSSSIVGRWRGAFAATQETMAHAGGQT